MYKQHQFKSIYDHNSQILILGSFPSVKSSELGFYYMHPSNRFWKLLSAIYEDDFASCAPKIKEEKLLKHYLALYDVINSCEITNSSDNEIKKATPNDIRKIISVTNITKIFINGRKAYTLFARFFPDLLAITTPLPSTSAANVTYTYEKLLNAWSIIKNENK